MNNQKIAFKALFPIIEEKINLGDSFSFLAFGNSMLPFIKNGKDIVTLSPIKRPILKNDVVFYRRKSGQFVLHRVVRRLDSGEFWLCGDNEFQIEKGIEKEQIIALLTDIKRGKNGLLNIPFISKIYLVFLPLKRSALLFRYKVKNRIQFF